MQVQAVRGPYRNGMRTREQLIAVATDAFGGSGFRGTSVREIAAAVGVSAPTLLAHFGRKEELLLAVLDAWDARTRQVEPARSPGLGWFARYPNLMRFHMEHPGLLRLFITISAEATEAAHPAHRWVADRALRLQEEGVEQLAIAADLGEMPHLAEADRARRIRSLYAVMDGYALRWLIRPDFDLAADYRTEFDTTMRGWRGEGACS